MITTHELNSKGISGDFRYQKLSYKVGWYRVQTLLNIGKRFFWEEKVICKKIKTLLV